MTLSDRQGHSPTASLFKWDSSYSCAAVDVAVVGCDREAAGCSQLCISSSTGQSPRCTCVPGYTLDSDGTGCVADTWAIPGVILVYNEAGKLQAANLSALTDDDTERRRRSRSSVQLHRSNSRIDAIGTNLHSLTHSHILPIFGGSRPYCFHCRLFGAHLQSERTEQCSH